MMTGRLIIDGSDAYTTYGLYVKDGGLAALLAWPQMKNIKTKNWYERNGIVADLSNPLLDGRTVQLQFYLSHPDMASQARVLHYDLMNTAYHTFAFQTLGRTYTLRYVSNGAFTMNEGFDSATLTFAEDNVTKPTLGSTVTLDFGTSTRSFRIAVPDVTSVKPSGYRLDGIDFARFGMYVTKGTLDQFQKLAAAKEAMKRNISTAAGLIYDGSGAVYASYPDVTLNLHLRSESVTNFWKMWMAMFAQLFSAGEHTVDGAGRRFKCYYKSTKITKFYTLQDGGVWCDFAITMALLYDEPILLLGTTINGTTVAVVDGNDTTLII